MSRRDTINELNRERAVAGAPPARGKVDVLMTLAKAKDVTDFVRILLANASDEQFAALTKFPRAAGDAGKLKKKTDSISRMLRDQINDSCLNIEFQEAIAEFANFSLAGEEGKIWRSGTADAFEVMLIRQTANRPQRDASNSAAPAPQDNLDSRRTGPVWSLVENLCSIILFGNQDGYTDLDFELSGQPTRVTITDETGRRILLQREVVVRHCIIELNLGGAEIYGGLTALKRIVSSFLGRRDTRHLIIDVGGSARAPRLTVQVKEGAIGIVRPLSEMHTEPSRKRQVSCWLVEVEPGTIVSALVRIYGTELQDFEPASAALAGNGDGDEESAIAREGQRPLAADDRARIMMHLWKLARAAERNPRNRKAGVLTLAYDARSYMERKSAGE